MYTHVHTNKQTNTASAAAITDRALQCTQLLLSSDAARLHSVYARVFYWNDARRAVVCLYWEHGRLHIRRCWWKHQTNTASAGVFVSYMCLICL